MNSSHERDQSIERLLRQSRQVLGGPPDAGATDACLDAEMLAAWAGGALSGAALEMAESHVAGCDRCQSLVGALARINVAIPPAERAPAARKWLAWLVPLAAASVAIAVWVAVPRNELNRTPQSPPSIEIERRAETNAQEPAPPADQLQAPAGGSDLGAEKKEAGVPSQFDAQVRRDSAALEADRLDKQAVSGAIAPPPPAAAPRAAASALEPAPTVASTLREEIAVGIEIVSPDPMIRWRIAGSVVQRSVNGGATWESASTGIAADLTAGAAPSASVCWLVGRGGVVLVSTDEGRSWRRVPFPEVTDLSVVRARDPRSVSVTTVDGRTFSTTDNGATWLPRPLQDF